MDPEILQRGPVHVRGVIQPRTLWGGAYGVLVAAELLSVGTSSSRII